MKTYKGPKKLIPGKLYYLAIDDRRIIIRCLIQCTAWKYSNEFAMEVPTWKIVKVMKNSMDHGAYGIGEEIEYPLRDHEDWTWQHTTVVEATKTAEALFASKERN